MDRAIVVVIRALHDSLVAGIAKDEVMADECARMADIAERNGNQGFADVLRSLSRKHRIEVLELSTKLSLLVAEFRDVLGSKE